MGWVGKKREGGGDRCLSHLGRRENGGGKMICRMRQDDDDDDVGRTEEHRGGV